MRRCNNENWRPKCAHSLFWMHHQTMIYIYCDGLTIFSVGIVLTCDHIGAIEAIEFQRNDFFFFSKLFAFFDPKSTENKNASTSDSCIHWNGCSGFSMKSHSTKIIDSLSFRVFRNSANKFQSIFYKYTFKWLMFSKQTKFLDLKFWVKFPEKKIKFVWWHTKPIGCDWIQTNIEQPTWAYQLHEVNDKNIEPMNNRSITNLNLSHMHWMQAKLLGIFLWQIII